MHKTLPLPLHLYLNHEEQEAWRSSIHGKTILITGAAGFLPSHLAGLFLALGANVIGVDNFLTGDKKNLEHLTSHQTFSFIEADVIADPSTYLPSDVSLDFIAHLASPASPPRYQENPVATYMVNSYATHLLLNYMKDNHPGATFFFASTSEVYGDPAIHPQPESYWGNVNPNGVRSCYDEAKRLGETICGVFSRDFDMDVRIIRIFNTYGPHMDPDDGRILPQFFSQALKQQPLTIYGDGSQTRSYCFVPDLIRGMFLLMITAEAKGMTINIGNPDERTVFQTAKDVFKVVNDRELQEMDVEWRQLPKDDPTKRKPDITLAKKVLGWEPRTQFDEGLQHTLEYFRSVVQ
jgi:nucleoside-diphosphate-sugar epimerase